MTIKTHAELRQFLRELIAIEAEKYSWKSRKLRRALTKLDWLFGVYSA